MIANFCLPRFLQENWNLTLAFSIFSSQKYFIKFIFEATGIKNFMTT